MTEELKVCRKCHLELPITEFSVTDKAQGYRRSWCRQCESARVRAYYSRSEDYRKRANANSTKQRLANPRTPEESRRLLLKHRYDLTPEQFDQLLAAQDGKCALCKAETHGVTGQSGRYDGSRNWRATSWRVDHDHATEEVRGLLCHGCNVRLGAYETLMREVGEVRLLDYLTRPSPVLALPPPPPLPVDVRATARFVADLPPRYTRGVCSIEGCGGRLKGDGLCQKHYMRVRRGAAVGGAGNLPHVTPKGGEGHHKTTITEVQAREIKASTMIGKDLAALYSVSVATVSAIRTGRTWKHLE